MAKVLRTHTLSDRSAVLNKMSEEVAFLTRGVVCTECVEILIEKSLFDSVLPMEPCQGKMSGFKYRVVHGPGVRPGSLAVITRTEILFK